MDQFEAAKTGKLEWFLEHEKNETLPNLMETDSDGKYPHEYTCSYGHLGLLKYLFEKSSQKNEIDVTSDKCYAVRCTAQNGHLDVLKYLLEDCPQKNRVDNVELLTVTAISAAGTGSFEVAKYLFSITEIIKNLSHENWCDCRVILAELELTSDLSVEYGLGLLKEISPDVLTQLFSTREGYQQLLKYLRDQNSQKVTNTPKIQL